MNQTIQIHNVDTDKLDKQRLELIELSYTLSQLKSVEITNELVEQSQLDALDGVINMLDDWSDNIYFGEITGAN